MRGIELGRLLALTSLFWVAGTKPASAEPWQSTGPLKVQPATDRCVATAVYRQADRDLILALEDYPATSEYELRLYAPGNLREKWVQGKFFLGGARPERDWVVVRPSDRAGTIIYSMSLTSAEFAAAGESPELKIQSKLSPGDLTITGLREALPSLDACSADLLERWGYSKDFQREVTVYPKPEKRWASYASPHDYPVSAVSARAEGVTHALVDVNVGGRASNCRIIRTSGHRAIDATTCAIATRRARYAPARNARGQAIAAPFYLTIRWEIPKP